MQIVIRSKRHFAGIKHIYLHAIYATVTEKAEGENFCADDMKFITLSGDEFDVEMEDPAPAAPSPEGVMKKVTDWMETARIRGTSLDDVADGK